MINNIRQEIVNKLIELYPNHTIYVDDVPQKFNKPSFLINLINQDYKKRMSVRYNSTLSFDIAYFSDSVDLREDCHEVQLKLFRGMDLIGSSRVLDKQATIADDVLHFTFNINYSELLDREYIKMMQSKIIERTEV